MKKDKLSQRLTIVFIVMLLAIFQIVSFAPQQVSAAVVENGVTISAVDHEGNPVIPLTAVEITEGQTAFDILESVTESKEIELDAPIDPVYGAFVNNIGNTKLPENYYWTLVINGEAATVGADSYTVDSDDSLLFIVSGYPYETVDVKVSAVDQKGKNVLSKTVSLFKGSSAFDALKLAGNKANVNVDASIDLTYFAYINNIGETELGATDFWEVSLNDESMEQGLSSYQPVDGDHINLTVTSWEPPADDNDSEEDEQEQPDTGTELPVQEETPSENPKPEVKPVTNEEVTTLINKGKQYFTKNGVTDGLAAVALKAAGGDVPQSYIDALETEITKNEGNYRKVTDYEKSVLGLSAAGYDATDFAGYNLIEKIYSNERMTSQGNNGVIFALLAYDSFDYEIPSDAKWTRKALIDYLLEQQDETGGWPLFSGSDPSVDITGMALSALAPYKDQANVGAAINKAVTWLSEEQGENGGFNSEINGGDSSESTAQVIIGLASVGVDPTEDRFTKGNNLLQHLLSFKKADGGFAHLIDDTTSNYMASVQAVSALAAKNKEGSIYQFKSEEVNQPEEVKPPEGVNPPEPEGVNPPDVENQPEEIKPEGVNSSDKGKPIESVEKHDPIPASNGHQLPNTATPLYNLLVIGGVLALIGLVALAYSRRQSQNV